MLGNLKFVLVISAFTIMACSTGHDDGETINLADNLKRFEAGESELICNLRCSGSYGAAKPGLESLYRSKKWPELAESTIRTGYTIDLNWYYLGQAAEALGYQPAARKYYETALTTTLKCDSWPFNICGGIDVPGSARQSLDRMWKKLADNAVLTDGEVSKEQDGLVFSLQKETRGGKKSSPRKEIQWKEGREFPVLIAYVKRDLDYPSTFVHIKTKYSKLQNSSLVEMSCRYDMSDILPIRAMQTIRAEISTSGKVMRVISKNEAKYVWR